MSDTEILVKAENVSKKFCRRLRRSLWYGVKDLTSELLGRTNSHGDLRKDEFWAVNDVSFELKRGEFLGLIGQNGAGKSTLLKMLSGLIKPDKGRIEMRGRTNALIELGAGFNPILTGRENIYNKGAILGFTKREMDQTFEGIVHFAEIEEFIDMPLQNYSSGMKVRLGFAVSVQLDPDLLIIDEVLAVGDVGFRIKCFNKIQELANDCAVILVSHSMVQIASLCSHLLIMDRGSTQFLSKNIGAGIDMFLQGFDGGKQRILGSDQIKFLEASVGTCRESPSCGNVATLHPGDSLKVEVSFEICSEIQVANIRVVIFNMEHRPVAEVNNENGPFEFRHLRGRVTISAEIKQLHLNSGIYSIHVTIRDKKSGEWLLRAGHVANFRAKHSFPTTSDFLLPANWSIE